MDAVSTLYASIADSRASLEVIDIGENKGAANALNVGFSRAKGEYICWLSADDVIIDENKTQTDQLYEENESFL